MTDELMTVRQYESGDQNSVVALWKKCDLTRDWNNPELDIERKRKMNPELFLVGEIDSTIVATAMGGYDGHRGWIYYMGVDPDWQGRGFGTKLTKIVENRLIAIGCPKINLMVRGDNKDVVDFYESNGYKEEDTLLLGKRLIAD